MNDSAQNISHTVLITDVASLLGTSLSTAYLGQGSKVFGCGKSHPSDELLQNSNFTFADIDLSQPLPAHLPEFDLVIHLSSEIVEASLSSINKNILSIFKDGKSQVALCIPITSKVDFLEGYTRDKDKNKHPQFFLVGDVYGPTLKLDHEGKSYYTKNKLTQLISQAVRSDKIILENEGLDIIYPTYIEDASYLIRKYIKQEDSKITRPIASQNPLSALSASYEIQNAARLVLNKELGIFFSGPELVERPDPEATVHITDLGSSPKFNLEAGTKEIFNFLLANDKVKVEERASESEIAEFKETKIPKERFTKSDTPRKKIKLSPSSRSKKIFALIALLIILTFGKICLSAYLGYQDLKNARTNLLAGDFGGSKQKAKNAQKKLSSATDDFRLVSTPARLVVPGKTNGLVNALESSTQAADALAHFSEGADILAKSLTFSITPDSKSEGTSLADATAAFARAHLLSTYASELASSAHDSGIFKNKMQSASSDLHEFSQISQVSSDVSNLLPIVTGSDSKKSYLLLILNNTELRPGGGFIGSYAKVDFAKGKLTSVEVDDIYNIDGQLKEKILPPPQLTQKLGVKQLFLRDSNWTVDFDVNAATARDFYKKETGIEVDGVIAFDLDFMQKLLEKIGPIKLESYNEEITAENLFEKGEYYSEIGFTPGSTQKKDFFSTLAKALIDKITTSLSKSSQDSTAPLLALVDASKDGLTHKHLMFSLDDPTANAFIKSKSWDNPLPPTSYPPADDSEATRDFLALSEANIGANKVNRYLERNIDYEMTIGRDADLMAKLKITYKNNSPNNSWPAGTYVNYLRAYTPLSSGLEDYKENGVSDTQKVTVENQANLTVFASLLEVPVGETKTVEFTYRVPKNIKLETAPQYSIYFQKQPGTVKDPLKFTFHLPAYLKVDSVNNQKQSGASQTYEVKTDLEQDRLFTLGVTRK